LSHWGTKETELDPREVDKLQKECEDILSKFDKYDLPLDEEPRVKELLLLCMEVFNAVFGVGNIYFTHIQHDYYDNLGGIFGDSVSHHAVTQMLATIRAANKQAQLMISEWKPERIVSSTFHF
jgi:hypothetical protein